MPEHCLACAVRRVVARVFGRHLSSNGLLGRVTPHVNAVLERSTGVIPSGGGETTKGLRRLFRP
jgi:hypothetical protein